MRLEELPDFEPSPHGNSAEGFYPVDAIADAVPRPDLVFDFIFAELPVLHALPHAAQTIRARFQRSRAIEILFGLLREVGAIFQFQTVFLAEIVGYDALLLQFIGNERGA